MLELIEDRGLDARHERRRSSPPSALSRRSGYRGTPRSPTGAISGHLFRS